MALKEVYGNSVRRVGTSMSLGTERVTDTMQYNYNPETKEIFGYLVLISIEFYDLQ